MTRKKNRCAIRLTISGPRPVWFTVQEVRPSKKIAWGAEIISLFTRDQAVIAVAVGMLLPLVLYQFGDATQITFSSALRGLGLVKPMMTCAFLAYGVIGIPLVWVLGSASCLGLLGVYIAFFVALLLAGLLFLRHFHKSL